MRTLFALTCCFFLWACAKPLPQTTGNFVILEFSAPGQVVRSYRAHSYTETEFPRTVTFSVNGETITLSGSYQINEFLE